MRGLCLLLLAAAACAHASDDQEVEYQVFTEDKPDECNEVSELGDIIAIHYNMYINGSLMESSQVVNKGNPIEVTLGSESTLRGWNLGLQRMCVGEIRKLIVPPDYGLGRTARGVINGKTILVFTVELMDIKKQSSLAAANGTDSAEVNDETKEHGTEL